MMIPRPGLIWLILLFAPILSAEDQIFHAEFEGLRVLQGISLVFQDKILHAVVQGLWNQRTHPELFYLTSPDGGIHWKSISRLSQVNDSPIISKGFDSVRLAVRGNRRAVVWRSQADIPGTGILSVAYSVNDGTTWQRGENPATGDTSHNQSYPDLALDHRGITHLVWLDDREEKGNSQGLRYAESRDNGKHWLPEITLDDATCTCCWTRLALLHDQTPAVLYRGSEPHDMKLIMKPRRPGRWMPASVVGQFGWHFSGCPHCGGDVADAPTPAVQLLHSVVWTGKEGSAGLYYLRSVDGGHHWSKGLRLAGQNSAHPGLAIRDKVRLGLIFSEGSWGKQTLKFMHSNNAGQTWSQAIQISQSDTHAEYPHILSTDTGYSIFWTEKTADDPPRLALKKIPLQKQ
ncbi:MAG: sialidase family protein [Methylococcaceae bacterium]